MPTTPAANTEASSAPVLQVSNLSITTPSTGTPNTGAAASKTLVDGLSYCLNRGETLAIVGESGSGKSLSSLAVLHLLPRDLQLSGEIWLDDQRIDELSDRAMQQIRGKRIGMVFQEPMTALNPLHTIEKQVGEMLRLSGLSKAQTRAQVIGLLEQVKLPNPKQLLKRLPHELSGGQRQRVMIALALAQNPDILIADEPTTALDVTVQAQILELLTQLQAERQMAMILVSHDLNLVERYSDHVIVMKQGQVVEQGSTRQVFGHPNHDYTRGLLDHDVGHPLPEPDTATQLELDKLAVRFPVRTGVLNRVTGFVTALEPLSLAVRAGESLGIVGESGSGKTSMALAVARLIASEGAIELAGTRLDGRSERELRGLRDRFQMVFQDPFSSLNPRFTIERLIGEGVRARIPNDAERRARVAALLARVELPVDVIDRYPHELSGGQRQRVALARALMVEPKLLILDEPTSALDRTTQRGIVSLLRKLQAEDGLTYLFISHDLAIVRALCQRVLVLRHGQLLEIQPTEQLFKHPKTPYTRALIEAALRVGER